MLYTQELVHISDCIEVRENKVGRVEIQDKIYH